MSTGMFLNSETGSRSVVQSRLAWDSLCTPGWPSSHGNLPVSVSRKLGL